MTTKPSDQYSKHLEIPLEVVLSTNTLLQKCIDLISVADFNLEVLAARLDRLSQHRNITSNFNKFVGTALEEHILIQIESFMALKIGIQLDPIPRGTKTQNFRFYNTQELVAESLDQSRKGAGYDILISLTGEEWESLVVVLEAKMNRNPWRPVSDRGSLNEALTPGYINRKFAPLKEYFPGRSFGYVVVASGDAIHPTHGLQQWFVNQGGILLPLKWTYVEFMVLIDSLIQELGWKVTK
ncbi:hypothetical protein A2962_05445 [Candidatus Woesebacteria bacterium RIFCSPLOWO2_01_FULL_39_61]|uniref:Restriction endonuclease n=1 Tax=Candidatus Woesebacteria bacterium RIFCSPHIGHO2_02_FULL_39_13 TaxID=1802505 RepID=A0A1F7Z4T7_9BACT|nr:MAG: hypothetical protein A2692_00760 [Candidatus Woesebacteria bacterium RIFCSPHIGHO2_01_FULL_39_95]OGM34652.1 MAG: hypothetical protein A3D01_06450 [Candidatus Woesebacteria bacterium RIFCSPHIGHO2_02_FULL_39_13]OGM37394.1 MAG: hypothetical protein A3E13_05480 [Candidatus Woesebacteria bacterium RIFCSPHIGHO2_12_FULL_40_20]OGM68360.1 MAG: hypothetical protein A2962_05445 [Candidatus Woesebacteria bacterium RIFCSPLOWO2_01_FULL_39_61]OGM71892.1 MAG: hypothetical protein A3H19_05445 [Candidatus